MTDTAIASPFPTAETPTPDAPKVKKPRAPAAVIELTTPSGDKLKALKYPMPLKAPRFTLNVNGQDCEAAQTTFGAILYTYFTFNGASFYVPGHHKDGAFTLTYPEGYKFEPLKLDRAAQSVKAATAKAAKAPATAPAAEGSEAAASGDAASETSGEASGSSEAGEPSAATESASGSKRKAKR